ncbi:hypothetical protein [Paludisphaera borealis]|uniref:Uncharacterized protein n=1 Tax=Paludisphaera borealis TaxID=1387353 RepID=A0A1U7CYQ8_9BACT|nr:hypothetical protein [Paludisphaera borealis]APW64023.1 hypothetical protein BSF38_05612 [Paludisphaera borealis]
MPLYRECPSCRALLTEDQLTTSEGLCPYCDARVGAHGEFASPDAAPDTRRRRPLVPLSAPATLSGKLATALFLLFEQFALIAGLMLLIKLPSNIGIELIADQNPNRVDPVEILRLKILVDLFFGPIYMAGIVTLLANRMSGLPTTFREAAQAGLHNWASLFAARIVSGFFILCGVILFIIPGIILAIRYSLIDEAVVLEGATVADSRARSSALTAGKELKIFLAGLVSFFLIAAFFELTRDLAGQAGLFDDPLTRAAFDSLVDVFAIFYSIVLFLYYWEARTERESAGLLLTASKEVQNYEL